ncbi:hypothetical protein SNEBB_003648 [Seison nebaliae]|nr:hypothetical protein SNEBB_003648 [Seison nebaliae]
MTKFYFVLLALCVVVYGVHHEGEGDKAQGKPKKEKTFEEKKTEEFSLKLQRGSTITDLNNIIDDTYTSYTTEEVEIMEGIIQKLSDEITEREDVLASIQPFIKAKGLTFRQYAERGNIENWQKKFLSKFIFAEKTMIKYKGDASYKDFLDKISETPIFNKNTFVVVFLLNNHYMKTLKRKVKDERSDDVDTQNILSDLIFTQNSVGISDDEMLANIEEDTSEDGEMKLKVFEKYMKEKRKRIDDEPKTQKESVNAIDLGRATPSLPNVKADPLYLNKIDDELLLNEEVLRILKRIEDTPLEFDLKSRKDMVNMVSEVTSRIIELLQKMNLKNFEPRHFDSTEVDVSNFRRPLINKKKFDKKNFLFPNIESKIGFQSTIADERLEVYAFRYCSYHSNMDSTNNFIVPNLYTEAMNEAGVKMRKFNREKVSAKLEAVSKSVMNTNSEAMVLDIFKESNFAKDNTLVIIPTLLYDHWNLNVFQKKNDEYHVAVFDSGRSHGFGQHTIFATILYMVLFNQHFKDIHVTVVHTENQRMGFECGKYTYDYVRSVISGTPAAMKPEDYHQVSIIEGVEVDNETFLPVALPEQQVLIH